MVLQCFPGDRIAQIANKIDCGEANIAPYDYVLIHVGTNDIGSRASYQSILSDYGNLIGILRKKKRHISIIISAIIPRPKDHFDTDPMIRRVNAHLQKVMSKDLNFKFICTNKPFMFAGKIKLEMFAKRDKGLHLNTLGSSRLSYFFLRVISTM